MKRFLTTSFVALALALVVSASGAAPATHAFSDTETCPDPTQQISSVDGKCYSYDADGNQIGAGVAAALISPAPDPAAAATPSSDKLGPPVTPEKSLNGIMAYIVQLFAWLLGVAIITLDYAVFYTVVSMGSYVHNLSAVGITWQVLRDIGNIVIIFGFLAIGIATILNTGWYGDRNKALPMLLVAAVFLNFSLFISEAVIDTGNLFATQFYTQINGGVPAGAKISAGVLTGINNEGISNKIMSSLGLLTIYGEVKNSPAKAQELLDHYWTVGFMSIILFLVAAFVMFSLAFILIARFVILLFLIIIAPIGFAGLAVPQLKGTADKWWGALFEQTITAPVLLLCLYIALRVITDTQFLTGLGVTNKEGWTGTVSNNVSSFASVLISFLIAMGLLLAVVIISKKMSAFGADKASALAGKLTFGATAFAGRRTVGRLSNYTARKIRSSSLGRTETGRLLAGTFDRGAKASFDLRGIKAGGGLKALGGIDAGEAQKGGYRGREDELVKVRTDYAKSLRQSGGQKAATKAAQEEHDKNMVPLEAEEQAQLKTTKQIVGASREELKLERQKLENLRKSGASKEDIRDAQTAYTIKENAHKELVSEEAEKLDPVRNKMEAEKKRLEAATASNSVAANQRKYGEALQSGPVMKILRAPYDWPTAVGSARREAADKIIGESKKDKSQQQLDRLEAILAKAEPSTAGTADKKPT